MKNLLSLLVAVLVSLQCTQARTAHAVRNDLDNNIQANTLSMQKRRLGNTVHIYKAPPATVQMELGTQLVLTCDVLGRPFPSVQWLKNGEPAEYEEYSNDIFAADLPLAARLVSKLVVTAAVSGDVFTCVATSVDKQESASTTVFTVEGNDVGNLLTLQKLYNVPAKPIIRYYYKNMLQKWGTEVILPCRVSSPTKSQVMWLVNDQDIYNNSKLRVLPSGDLLIPDLEWSDMGNYTCIAKNIYGKDTADTFLYPVSVSPK